MNGIIFDRLWKDAEPNFFGTKEDFLKLWEGWKPTVVEDDGQATFIALVKGPLFHFHSFRTGKCLSLTRIREFLQDLIDEHGHALTKTPLEDGRQQRFNHRIGFVEVSRDEYDILYRIERINRSCQS